MTEYYELHLTIVEDDKVRQKDLQDFIGQTKWSYSRIDGDPVEGPGIKNYMTIQLNSSRHTLPEVHMFLQLARQNLERRGFNVTRDKIEVVIHDSSSSKVKV